MVEMFRKLLAQEAVVGAVTWTNYTLGPDNYMLYRHGLRVRHKLGDVRNLKLILTPDYTLWWQSYFPYEWAPSLLSLKRFCFPAS